MIVDMPYVAAGSFCLPGSMELNTAGVCVCMLMIGTVLRGNF